jgi:hypothetical protein
MLAYSIKLMTITNFSIQSLIESPYNENYVETRNAIKETLIIFGNSSLGFKQDLRKELIMITQIFVDGTPFKEASPEDKLQVYILIVFSSNITKRLSLSIQ